MEVLLFALFFVVTIVFFVAGKDDFGRKEIKLKSDMNEENKTYQKDELKDCLLYTSPSPRDRG